MFQNEMDKAFLKLKEVCEKTSSSPAVPGPKIAPCLWFTEQAAEASAYYCSVFENTKITAESPFMSELSINCEKVICLNGRTDFTFNPSISLFVTFENETALDHAWSEFQSGGKVLMALDKYPWSEKYGWIQDKFGVNWQMALGRLSDTGQFLTPSLLFTGKQKGRAEEAMEFYTAVFQQGSVEGILKYAEDEKGVSGLVKHAQFKLGSSNFMVMDNPLEESYGFNESVSFVITCETQAEIDYYWAQLTNKGTESKCGWLKDQFGVSWQVVPAVLPHLLQDPARAQRVIAAFLKMKKFVIDELLNA